MDNLTRHFTTDDLERAKQFLVPSVFSENYFKILKARMEQKRLSSNDQYYYNHFIKKKLQGMLQLFSLDERFFVHGRDSIREDRLDKAVDILKRYSQKHKGMRVLISGSFLFSEKYNDIDVFVLSKYSKEDYREGDVHVNYLPADAGKSLFFASLSKVCVSSFRMPVHVDENIGIDDLFQLYEYIVLLILQKDDFLPELRDFVVRLEYLSSGVVLDTVQLKTLCDKLSRGKSVLERISKYFVAKAVSIYRGPTLKRKLKLYIKRNSTPEKGLGLYPNWKVYNSTYKEVLGIVS